MAVRVADSLKQQNDLKTFPVAYSEDIWIDKNKGEGDADYKDLQTLYNEGALGGSGLPEPESKDKLLLSVENEETSELEWSQVDKGTVDGSAYVNLDIGSDLNTLVTHGRYRTTTKRVDRIENLPVQVAGMLTVRLTGSVIYQTYNSIDNKMYTRTSEDAGENWSDWKDVSEGGDEPFIGTEEKWEALSLEEKAKYKIVNFLDDDGSGESVDKYSTEEVKTNKVWIDGKPIYRKVLQLTITSACAWESVLNISSLFIDNVVSMNQTIYRNEGVLYPTSYFYTTADVYCFYLMNNNTQIGAWVQNASGNAFPVKITITLEYTKTN